jgi:hypothetical protein
MQVRVEEGLVADLILSIIVNILRHVGVKI